MVGFAYLLVLASLCCCVSAAPKVGDGNVVQVHAIFRHGERTPADTYPNDPHINQTFYPTGWGQLTNRGKTQQLEQGRFLRSRYLKLIGDLYSPDVVYSMSTDVDRSLMSAQLELAGLFPPGPLQKFDDKLGWQPAPVHTIPLHLDNLLLVRNPCPRYWEELERVKNAAPTTELLEQNAELLRKLSEFTGDHIKTLDDVQSLYNTLLAEERFNLTLPEWTRGIYPDRLINMTSYSFIVNVQTDEMKRLKAGPLLSHILKHMENRAQGKKSKKIHLYSGHDSTIANMLAATENLKSPYIPGYNAMVIFELLEEEPGKFSIRMFRRSLEQPEPELLRFENTSEHTYELAEFAKRTAKVRPSDWKEECVSHDPNFRPPTPPPP